MSFSHVRGNSRALGQQSERPALRLLSAVCAGFTSSDLSIPQGALGFF